MLQLVVYFVLCGALLATAAPVSPRSQPADIFERGNSNSCNADNLLRLLRTPTNLPAALPFCSTYLKAPRRTVTASTLTPTSIAATVTPTQTVVVTDTVTQTLTSYTTVQTTDVFFSTLSNVQVSTIVAQSTVVVTSTSTIDANQRRAAPTTALSDRVTSSYDAIRISSACNCLTIPLQDTSVTATAPIQLETVTVPTVTATSQSSVTTDTTIYLTETTRISVTETITTDVLSSTTVVTPVTLTTIIQTTAATCTPTPLVSAEQQLKDAAALDFLQQHDTLTTMLSSFPMSDLIAPTIGGTVLPPIQAALQNWVPCTAFTASPQLLTCKNLSQPRPFTACIMFYTNRYTLTSIWANRPDVPTSALTKTTNDYKTLTVSLKGDPISTSMDLISFMDAVTPGGAAESRDLKMMKYYWGEPGGRLF